jgi:hypothetical protein
MPRANIEYHNRIAGINAFCRTLMNVETPRCSIDGEWATELRYNGGPGEKSSKMAVISVAYMAPDTPPWLGSAIDLKPYCRVGVFQVNNMLELPVSLRELSETKSIVKTGKNFCCRGAGLRFRVTL